jgi:hypothetical protein
MQRELGYSFAGGTSYSHGYAGAKAHQLNPIFAKCEARSRADQFVVQREGRIRI